jgi:hypothetical protein
MASSIFVSSMFMVSGRMSTNTSLAPTSTKAVAVVENVKLGKITSSPGSNSQRMAAISSAVVPLVVSSALVAPKRSSSHWLHCFVKGPSPQILRLASAASRT